MYTFKELYDAVSKYLGLGSTPLGDDLETCKFLVNRGYARFLNKREWSFMVHFASRTLSAGQSSFALPDDFSMLKGKVIVGGQGRGEEVKIVNETILYHCLSNNELVTSQPEICAVRYELSSARNEIRGQEMLFFPAASENYTIYYRYITSPPKLVNPDDYPHGGADNAEVVLQCALAAAESWSDESLNVQEQMARDLIADAVRRDLTKGVSDSLGYNSDANLGNQNYPAWTPRIVGGVTYDN